MYTSPPPQGSVHLHPHMNSSSHALPPPTPTTASAAELSNTYSAPPTFPPRPPPPRREHAIQLPALTTSLSGVAYRIGGPPPTPATMSSPFIPSSVPLSGMSSPMSARPAGYQAAAPYNPQQWGPIGVNTSTSPQIGIGLLTPMATPMSAASRGLGDELGRSGAPPGPPPPYSPPRSSSQAPSPRPVQSTAMSPGYPRQSGLSPAQQQVSSMAYGSSVGRRRPSSMVYGGDPPATQHTSLPPPPGGLNTSVASSSRDRLNINLGDSGIPVSPGRMSPDYNSHSADMSGIAPGSRRAASTGDLERTHGYARSRRWEPGMPLPPPPPGPPPRGTSPATNPTPNEYAYNSAPRERTRRPPPMGMNLPTVPPTPADWVDTESTTQTSSVAQRDRRPSDPVPERQFARQQSPELSSHNNNSTPAQSVSDTNSATSSNRTASASGGAKGIRERRIEARLGNTPAVGGPSEPSSSNPNSSAWPADLVLASPGGPGLSRRRTVMKSTPRSARSNPEDLRGSGAFPKSPFVQRSAGTDEFPTPKGKPMPRRESDPSTTMQTPPFSPGFDGRKSPHLQGPSTGCETSRGLHPKTLPTPPLSVPPDSSPSLVVSPGNDRPISHLLHLPVDASPTHVPLIPRRSSISRQQSIPTEEEFVREAEARYREFLVNEAGAASDEEGLKVFCDFVIAESAVRRKRYESVWATGSFDLDHFISGLFPPPAQPPVQIQTQRSHNPSPRVTTTQPIPSVPPLSPSPAGSRLTVDTSPWQYRPTLSPIASMSISNDEISSRGRAPSRWWESQTGSESGGNKAPAVNRSKRETKYMGLPREMREAMQLEVEAMGMREINGDGVRGQGFPMTNPFSGYGPNEYPPEKSDGAVLRRAPSNSREKLDISRLVTLPPSYPRHYPAVNNSHPDLSFYRSTVRSVSDLSELKVTKQEHDERVKELRRKYEARIQEERRNFKAGINRGIAEGSISYAEAAEAEAVRRSEEHEQERELVQAEFDLFQEEVYKPMRSILSDRINITSTCIDELRSKLFDSAQHSTPNQTQEGGDEQPELLEKLTQLKWLFEAREALYREEFTLQTEHDEKYRNVVTLPYHHTKNRDKLIETQAFFTRDADDRALTFATDTSHRFETFLSVIDEHVTRGVEAQLSAFWDIAPSLLELLQCVPDDLASTTTSNSNSGTYFAIKIPQEEYDENPSYFRHPMQYLYSLISHAEKSTFQFIEAQTNLFCLLHEVRSGLMNAKCNVLKLWRVHRQGGKMEIVAADVATEKENEEQLLTADLKDKVGMVEEQWDEALGKVMGEVKRRVKMVLEERGGWDEMVQMGMEQA